MDDRTDDELIQVVRQAALMLAAGVGRGRKLVQELGDGALVRGVVRRIVAEARASAIQRGWNDDDLRELERRRLRAPADAGEVERQVRLLGLLDQLPAAPVVAPPGSGDLDEGMLGKIRALLAKAESTIFPAEAESLTAKAQELLGRHRIDRAALDGRGSSSSGGPAARRIWLDDPYASAKFSLLSAVADANRCQAVLLRGIGCCHVVGFAADLEVVEVLHTSLLVQATTAMAASGPKVDHRGRTRTRSFRQSFLVGFAARIRQRLGDASAAGEAEGIAVHGRSLLPVLARREQEVELAVRNAFPRLQRSRASSSNGDGLVAGIAAADRADLSVRRRLRTG